MNIYLSTLQKKQIVGVTGLAMVGFVIAHLSGNFLIFKGYKAFNAYAHFLHGLGALLWVMRIGLIAAFMLHMGFTINLVIQNRKARKEQYYKYNNHRSESSLAVRLMPLTGSIIFIYIIVHLLDFTFAEKIGVIEGVDYGLYGLVVNTLGSPIHAMLYIVAMAALGLHLVHACQSIAQTFGLVSQTKQVLFTRLSQVIGWGIAIGFSSIPMYIMLVL